MKLLMIDNYDSFTWNLVHLFEELGAEVDVFRNDAITVEEAEALAPDRLVISPGPGRPEDAGVSVELIRTLGASVPTLGVCLGHQAIVEAFGGRVGRAQALLHGKSSVVRHDGKGVYVAWRRRSRRVATTRSRRSRSLPSSSSRPGARTAKYWAFGTGDTEEGVQFHPESVLTRRSASTPRQNSG